MKEMGMKRPIEGRLRREARNQGIAVGDLLMEAADTIQSLIEERDNLRDRVNEAGVTIIELRGRQGILTEQRASLVALLEEALDVFPEDEDGWMEKVRALLERD